MKELPHTFYMRAIQCVMYRIGLSRKEKQHLSSEHLSELFAHLATDKLKGSVVKS